MPGRLGRILVRRMTASGWSSSRGGKGDQVVPPSDTVDPGRTALLKQRKSASSTAAIAGAPNNFFTLAVFASGHKMPI